MASPTRSKQVLKPAAPDAVIKKVEALLADAALDDITTTVAGQIAPHVGAAAVRELHCQVPTNKGLREIRVAPDATSVVGYAAMTNTRAFAWMGDLPNRRYVVAIPLAADADMLGVIEMIHAQPNVVFDDNSIAAFDAIARAVASRIKSVSKVAVRTSPYDHLLKARFVTQDQLRDARGRASAGGRSVETELLATGIDKSALGKSLSEHFGKPFVAEPEALPLAADLIRRFGPLLEIERPSPRRPQEAPNARSRRLEPPQPHPQDDLSRQLGGVSLALSVGVAAALERSSDPAAARPGGAQAGTRAEIVPRPRRRLLLQRRLARLGLQEAADAGQRA
jgi:hypothetical protein